MAKRVFRFFNRAHILLYRLTRGRVGGRILGIRVLLLTTKGRKSGKERTVPLGTFEDRGRYVVVASNGGLDVHPAWFFNLRNDPRVRIQVGAVSQAAEARLLEGEERTRVWQKLVSLAPGYSRYEKSTQRVIPLVALNVPEGIALHPSA